MRRFCGIFGLLIVAAGALLTDVIEYRLDIADNAPSWLRNYLVWPAGAAGDSLDPEVLVRAAASDLQSEPATPYWWGSMAEALLTAARSDEALYSARRAGVLGQHLPPVLIRTANLQFRLGEIGEALTNTSRILSLAAAYDGVIFSSYRRLEVPVTTVLAEGLPEEERAHYAYFNNLLEWANPAQIEASWDTMNARFRVSEDIRSRYLNYLIGEHLYDKSISVWVLSLGPDLGSYRAGNFVYNGAFDREPSPSPFDWRVTPLDGVQVSRDEGGIDGGRALRMEFAGQKNLVYSHIAQMTYLPPGRYKFRAQARSEELSTDKGIYIRILARDPAGLVDARTNAITGTAEWRELRTDFEVTAAGTLLDVRICRDESLKIDSKISGRIWIDDVVLERRKGRRGPLGAKVAARSPLK